MDHTVIVQIEGRGAWRMGVKEAYQEVEAAMARQKTRNAFTPHLDDVYVTNSMGCWEPGWDMWFLVLETELAAVLSECGCPACEAECPEKCMLNPR